MLVGWRVLGATASESHLKILQAFEQTVLLFSRISDTCVVSANTSLLGLGKGREKRPKAQGLTLWGLGSHRRICKSDRHVPETVA